MSRSDIPDKEMKALFLKSGNLCAFPDCDQSLLLEATATDQQAVVGEMAHIVADSRQGPRGRDVLADQDRNKETNLILLCRNHHRIIDTQPLTYSIPVLRQMKRDHEARIQSRLKPKAGESSQTPKTEILQNTILSVTHLPQVVFAAPCTFNETQKDKIKENIDYRDAGNALLPFVLHNNRLLSFFDLRQKENPFEAVLEGESKDVELLNARDMWKTAEGLRLYQMLLNRSLHKLTARRGIRYDPLHRRYYFSCNPGKEVRTVRYNSLGNRRTTRKVAWCPVKKSTGESRNFWWHWAAGLKFHLIGQDQWCMSIRPERHLTKDGEEPLPPDWVGRRVTSLKARMYNDAYLKEVHFWRDYLSDGTDRFTFDFGSQSAIVSTSLIPITVSWPGIPNDTLEVKSREPQEDLFSYGDLMAAMDGEQVDWEDEADDEIDNDLPPIDGMPEASL